MGGLAGTLGLSGPSVESAASGMQAVLSRHDESDLNLQRGDSWCLTAARPKRAPVVVQEGKVVGALYGTPQGPLFAQGDAESVVRRLCSLYEQAICQKFLFGVKS